MDSRFRLRRRTNLAWDVEGQIHDHHDLPSTLGFVNLPICSFICKVYELLGTHNKRVLGLLFWVMEAVSLMLDVLGKNKLEFLLAAFVLSALGFAFTFYAYIKRRSTTTQVAAERQLKVVDLVFSSIQLLVSLIHYLLALLKVDKNFSASVFPLAFATVAVVFIFKNDDQEITSSSAIDSQQSIELDLLGTLASNRVSPSNSLRLRSNSASNGIERIPTPRIPVSLREVLETLSRINMASKRKDQVTCRNLVSKIKALAKESKHNKKCIESNGTDSVLSAAFEVFSKTCLDENVVVLEEILSTLTLLFPLNVETVSWLGSNSSLHCMVWCLKSGDLSRSRNAVLVLKEVVSSDPRIVNALSEIEGTMETLFKLIKEPISPASTKASITIIYEMVTATATNEKTIEKFVKMGLVSLLLEVLVDSERSLCEKSIGVLDGICNSEEGREKAYNNALTMPVVVKKILRVSDVVNDFAVSVLLKLWKNEKKAEKTALVEALQLGAFQKLLLLVQVGCAEKTKERACELLKLLNPIRKLECIDSMDFKYLRKS